MIAPPTQPRTITLGWNRNEWMPGTVTEVWSATNLAGPWTLRTNVSVEQVLLPCVHDQEFFKIRNRTGSLVSDWSRNQP